MEHNMVNKLSTLLRLGLVSKNNVRRATALLQNPEKAMSNPAYRTLMQDILVDIMDRILNSKALYTAVRQNLVREPMITTEGVEEDRTKNLLRSGLVPKKDIMVARRALSSPAKAKSMATVRAYRELMIDLLDSMVGKITGSPTLYNAFKQTMGKQKVEDMEESFEQPNEDTIAELLLHETAQELMEKNKPTKPDLWAQAKSKAKSKFKVYPSAYANGWAVKWYNEHGGGWKSVNEGKNFFGLRSELDEALIGGQKKLDVNKNKKLDSQDFALLRAKKKKPVQEGTEQIAESEYKEVLTGYPNRGMNTDHGATDHRSTEFITQVNAVLKAIGRYTFHNPSEAFLRIKTRLNLLMLDFPWTPYMWQDGGTGTTVLTVTRYGRVDGVDASTGQIRMDGRAAPTDGFLEFNLVAQTEIADDGFYRVTARLEPKSEIGLPLAVEEETGSTQTNRKSPTQNEAARKRARELRFKLESLKGKSVKEEADLGEDYQTPAREREMDRKVQKHEDKAQSGYAAKMTKTGKAAARGRRQEAKHDAASRRLLKRAEKEQDSPRTYGRGGKLIKRGSRAEVKEETKKPWWEGKTRAELDAAAASASAARKGEEEEKRKRHAAHNKGKRFFNGTKWVKEEAEQIDEKKMKQWTPRLDKLFGSSRDAVRSKPKKSKILRKIKDGKVVSTKVIRINPVKKSSEVKEQSVNPEFTTGMPLITPEPSTMPKAPAPKAKKKQSRFGSY